MSRYDMARERPDDFQTKPWALDVLVPFLRPTWTIWECAAGKGRLVAGLSERGFIYRIATDKFTLPVCRDFLTWQPDRFDCIVTNPPYTLKDEFLARCYELGKPFALLLPFHAFQRGQRQNLYKDHGLEIIFLPRRPEFETPSGKNSGSWFAAAWFTNGLNIGQQLTFNPPPASSRKTATNGDAPFVARTAVFDRVQERLPIA